MKLLFALISIIILQGSTALFSQEVKSKTMKIRLNSLPAQKADEDQITIDSSPPTIHILSPENITGEKYQTSETEFRLIGEVTDESKIRFVSVNTDIRMVDESGIFISDLTLQPGENTIRLAAMDDHNNIQEQFLVVEFTPEVITLADRISEESTYYALIIGINQYADEKLPDLDNPINDADNLYRALTENYTFNEEHIQLLKDATRAEIIDGLDDLDQKVTPDDNLLIFYAGHGWWDEDANTGYWLPADADDTRKSNWFRNSTLVDYLKEINSKHTLLITDACFGGAIFKTRSAAPTMEKAYERLYELPSRKAMTSGSLTEVPDESAFVRFLIDRLEKNQDTYLPSEQLFSSFQIAVINNSDVVPRFGEIGNVGDQGGDFIFLKRRN